MRIKRLEFGLSRMYDKVAWRYPRFHIGKENCGCFMGEFWCLYVTWLGDECYYPCGDPSCCCNKE